MNFRVLLLLTVLPALCSACTTADIQEQEGGLLPAAALLNGIKCEIASFAAANPRTPIVTNQWTIQGDLDLHVASETKAGVTIDVVVPLTEAKAGFGFDVGGSEGRSRKASVDFVLRLNPKPDAGCVPHPTQPGRLSDGSVVVDDIGLASWLTTISSVSGQGASFDPRKVVYVVTFGVKRYAGASGGISGFAVVPIALKGSALAKRDDAQVLSVTLYDERRMTPGPGGKQRSAARARGAPQVRPDIKNILAQQRAAVLSGP